MARFLFYCWGSSLESHIGLRRYAGYLYLKEARLSFKSVYSRARMDLGEVSSLFERFWYLLERSHGGEQNPEKRQRAS